MAQKTILELVTEAAEDVGTTIPDQLVASRDGDARQWLRHANAIGKDLQVRYGKNVTKKEYRFTGADLTIDTALTPNRQYIELPEDFSSFAGASSLWDDTLDVQCNGPLLSEAQLAVLARETTSSRPYWWLTGGRINIYPIQGDTRKFLYLIQADQWVLDGSNPQDTITSDGNTTIFDNELFTLGLIWRWRFRKGLSYAQDKADYEMMFENRAGADRGERSIRTAALYEDIPDNYWPGIIDVPT